MNVPLTLSQLLRHLGDIAAAGFAPAQTRAIARRARWELNFDEDVHAQFYVDVDLEPKEPRCLSIQFPGHASGPFALLPLNYFGEDADFATVDRRPFDDDFRRLERVFRAELGQPWQDGTYRRDFRPEWPYHYCIWQAGPAQFVLLQDEHDIQFGMDITLWTMPITTKVFLPFGW